MFLTLIAKIKNSRKFSDLQYCVGAQWLSGRVLDSRPRGRGFEPLLRHCVVVLERLLVGRKESYQTNKQTVMC